MPWRQHMVPSTTTLSIRAQGHNLPCSVYGFLQFCPLFQRFLAIACHEPCPKNSNEREPPPQIKLAHSHVCTKNGMLRQWLSFVVAFTVSTHTLASYSTWPQMSCPSSDRRTSSKHAMHYSQMSAHEKRGNEQSTVPEAV